jgi:hypothetical protein
VNADTSHPLALALERALDDLDALDDLSELSNADVANLFSAAIDLLALADRELGLRGLDLAVAPAPKDAR